MHGCTGISRGVLREVLNHRLCVAHPNIVQFREIFLTNKHLAIVMEYASGGDMFDYVIRNKVSAFYCTPPVNLLFTCHRCGPEMLLSPLCEVSLRS